MRDKYAYVPAAVPAGATVPVQRLAVVHQYIIDFFADQKATRKGAAATAVTNLQTALATPHANLVTAFRTYEAAHLDIGNMSGPQLTAAITAKVQERYKAQFPAGWGAVGGNAGAQGFGQQRVTLAYAPNVPGGYCDITAQVREPATAVPTPATAMGRVYAGDSRFEALGAPAQPANRQNDVYIRRGAPNQHYIRYQRGGAWRFVRRYVVRGLNQGDSVQIAGGNALQAPHAGNAHANEILSAEHSGKHNVAVGTALTDAQQVLSHTRGWRKRFISTTTTNRPAYSTRGEEFRSVFGKAIVDLAFVPGADIFDLHAPNALNVFHTDGASLHTAAHVASAAHRSFHDEELLAARDVVRTREVLLRTVPFAAIRVGNAVASVIGILHNGAHADGSATFNLVEAAWGAHPRAAEETLAYHWGPHHRWYKFYRFATAGAATAAWNAIPVPQQGAREMFNEYDFPAVLPVGFAR